VYHKCDTFTTTVLRVHLAAGQTIDSQSKRGLETIPKHGDLLVIPNCSLLVLSLGSGQLPPVATSQWLCILHEIYIVCNVNLKEIGFAVLAEVISK
jgi:hypothetical protein